MEQKALPQSNKRHYSGLNGGTWSGISTFRTWTILPYMFKEWILPYIVKYVIKLKILRGVFLGLSRRPYCNHADLYKIQTHSKGTEAEIRAMWPQPKNARAITRSWKRQGIHSPLELLKDCSFTIFWTFSLQISERLYFHCLSYHICGNSGL